MEYPEDESVTSNDGLDEMRMSLKEQLPAIALEIEVALKDAGLNYPVFLCVPSSGRAVATVATALDPADDEWDRIGAITRQIIAKRPGIRGLSSTELTCAAANHTMTVVDLAPKMADSAA